MAGVILSCSAGSLAVAEAESEKVVEDGGEKPVVILLCCSGALPSRNLRRDAEQRLGVEVASGALPSRNLRRDAEQR